MLNALLLPCEEASTLIPPSCSDHFIHFSGLFLREKKVHSEDGFYLDK